MKELSELIGKNRIIVCCGSGGVGKTTNAAALAVEGARQGKRTCVVTIDPARRLADALGLDSLSNSPRQLEGEWCGELWALMLDSKSTFDAAIIRYARDTTQAEAILGNRLYRNLRDALSGTQEYMAVEKLYQLHQEGGFDLIVVDTPPTRRAIDFLNAPRHLTGLLDHPAVRLLVAPGRAYVRAISFAARAPLHAVAKIVGAETFLDALAFARAFEGMESGIRTRAGKVSELFSDPSTAFVLIVAPREDSIEEGRLFAAHLAASGIPVRALIVNRVQPHFDPQPHAAPLDVVCGTSSQTRGDWGVEALANLRTNWVQLRSVATYEDNSVAALGEEVAPALVVRVPLLEVDVHDLEGVEMVADHLFGLTDSGHHFANAGATRSAEDG